MKKRIGNLFFFFFSERIVNGGGEKTKDTNIKNDKQLRGGRKNQKSQMERERKKIYVYLYSFF